MAQPIPPRIDTHAHFIPPVYRERCEACGLSKPDGMPGIPPWDERSHIKLMDDNNISKSILSISSPGTHLDFRDVNLARQLTRDCNAYAADLKKRIPERFGYFASLPIPDVKCCLEEIDLGISEGCDGFIMETNGHGVYPGDKELDEIFDVLNEKGAILFIHPTTPACSCYLSSEMRPEDRNPQQPTPLSDHYPAPMFEFLFDTARFITHMFLSGTLKRCPRIRIILPHLGGAIVPLVSRVATYSGLMTGSWTPVTEEEMREAFQKQFWFDLAGVPFPGQIRALLHGTGVTHSRLLYGSDYPFTQASLVRKLAGDMDRGMEELFTKDQVDDVYHRNAESLFEGLTNKPKIAHRI